MRVLFTTWAWPSHYFPMVPLAWALRTAGHEVRMTSQPALLPTMSASGLPATAIGRDIDVAAAFLSAKDHLRRTGTERRARTVRPDRPRLDRASDRMVGAAGPASGVRTLRALEEETVAIFRAISIRGQWTRPDQTLSLYGEVAEAMVDDLLALARSWRPDLIVYDPITHAGPLVANLLGVPAVRNLFGPDVTYFVKANDEAGLVELWERFGVSGIDLLGAATVDPTPPSLQFPEVVAAVNRIPTRYVPYGGLSEVPDWLPDRPQRNRICLTWGTSIHRLFGDQAFLPGEVLQGCAKLADERDAELVLAITASQRPLLTDVPASVRVVESVPLDALLPTCDALIHQGGAGTMLTGLRHGLPQIVLTQVLDEAANALRVEAAGAGLTRAADGLPAGELLALGHELLDNPAYRAAAQRLRQENLDQPAPADIVDELVHLST
jgi:UDP:flavonoid glycosyltransferase YjiC (YdhE family)